MFNVFGCGGSMILSEFAKFLQQKDEEIIKNKTTLSLLTVWILSVLQKEPKTNTEKIIHKEIDFYKNEAGDFFLVAKSKSGRKLTQSLYNYALSYEQHLMRKWLEERKPDDFKSEN